MEQKMKSNYASGRSAYNSALSERTFRTLNHDVDEAMKAKLLGAYQVQAPPGKAAKVWGIDPMSTPLAMAIVRLSQNFNDPNFKEEMFKGCNLGGIMAFCIDRRKRVFQMRLFDINDFRLLF